MHADDAASVHEARERGFDNNVEVSAVLTSADHMATDEELLRERIGQALSGRPDACVEASLALLQSLAKSLSQLIGANGIDSLLFRIARRVSNEYPWFPFGPRTLSLDPEFAALRSCFDAQEPGQARAASMLFFGTLIEVLASLIGAHLTTLIFKSALGGGNAAASSKEQNDE